MALSYNIRPFRMIERRKTRQIMVGDVAVGGDAPISVQTMTNTLTTDHKSTIEQINRVTEAGADIVRVSCPDAKSTESLKTIIKHVDVPLVADIHFHYKRAIEAAIPGLSLTPNKVTFASLSVEEIPVIILLLIIFFLFVINVPDLFINDDFTSIFILFNLAS